MDSRCVKNSTEEEPKSRVARAVQLVSKRKTFAPNSETDAHFFLSTRSINVPKVSGKVRKATQAQGKLHGYYGAVMLGKAGLEEQPLN